MKILAYFAKWSSIIPVVAGLAYLFFSNLSDGKPPTWSGVLGLGLIALGIGSYYSGNNLQKTSNPTMAVYSGICLVGTIALISAYFLYLT